MKTSAFKTFSLWALAIIAAALLAGWVFILIQSYAYRAEIAALRNEIESQGSQDSYLLSIRNVLRGTEGNLETLRKRFISEDGVSPFISFLESEGERFGVKTDIGGITMDPVGKNSVFKILHVRVNGSGTWSDVVSFVHALDVMPYASRIDRVTFSRAAEPATGWNVAVDISQNVQ